MKQTYRCPICHHVLKFLADLRHILLASHDSTINQQVYKLSKLTNKFVVEIEMPPVNNFRLPKINGGSRMMGTQRYEDNMVNM